MNIILSDESFKRLLALSTIRRQFFGDCAEAILEEYLANIDFEAEKAKARSRFRTVEDGDSE